MTFWVISEGSRFAENLQDRLENASSAPLLMQLVISFLLFFPAAADRVRYSQSANLLSALLLVLLLLVSDIYTSLVFRRNECSHVRRAIVLETNDSLYWARSFFLVVHWQNSKRPFLCYCCFAVFISSLTFFSVLASQLMYENIVYRWSITGS